MNKCVRIVLIVLVFLSIVVISSQAIGLSLSYFLPRNGYFSHPVTPLSFRDIGVTFGKYIGVAGSLSLYSFDGMALKGSDGTPLPDAGAMYYLGGADMNFTGDYLYDDNNSASVPLYLQDVKLDYSGLELMVGGSYKM